MQHYCRIPHLWRRAVFYVGLVVLSWPSFNANFRHLKKYQVIIGDKCILFNCRFKYLSLRKLINVPGLFPKWKSVTCICLPRATHFILFWMNYLMDLTFSWIYRSTCMGPCEHYKNFQEGLRRASFFSKKDPCVSAFK